MEENVHGARASADAPARRCPAYCWFSFSFRPELEELFRDHYYSSIRSSVLTVASVGVLLNVYKLALGTVLLNIGPEEYAIQYDLLWDFYLWACPGMDLWVVAILEPILEGGACLVVVLCWPYAYSEGRPMHYRRNLLIFFYCSLVTTVLTVLFMAEGPLGKCATGQVVMIMFIYMMTLRPLLRHCMVMGFLVAVCFFGKILASGIQCDVIADVAMVAATIYVGLGAAVAAVERTERAHFVAVQLANASQNTLLGLVDRMLPPVMASQLVQQWGGHIAIGERYDQVSVLFCELQTPAAEALPTLVDLNELFSILDSVVDTVPDACKIETVGGQFVVAAGVPSPSKNHAGSMALLATRIRSALESSRWSTGEDVKVRIGIHSGTVAAGVVGTATPRFRLFGDTINTTARMSTRAQWGETVVSHAFAQSLGLPPRETAWGVAGDLVDGVWCQAGIRLVCDGEVPIKGKGMFCVWRLETGDAAGDDDAVLQRAGSDSDADVLFETLVQKQEGLRDEGSALARSMIIVASEYDRAHKEDAIEVEGVRDLLWNMLVRGSGFERMFLRFKAPLMLPAQLVHAVLMVMCTSGMFAVDVTELLAARQRGEDVDLLIGIGIACNLSCLAGLVVLAMLFRMQHSGSKPGGERPAATSRRHYVQDVSTVMVWITTIVFLELVHAFGKGENVSSWAYVIAGFLRAHTLYNLLCNGLALHPQPLGFLLGALCLLAARAISHIKWEQRAHADQLVTMISAQCGMTEEWKPRGLFQVLLILALTTYAYISRQLMERTAVQKLLSTVRSRRRALEITSSLLPAHVIPKLEQRALKGAVGNMFSLAEKHESVIILHADVVGFTSKCARTTAADVFQRISQLFNALDDLCREFQLTKIETIGDAYWCSHGLEAPATPADARKMLRFAEAMRRVVGNFHLAGEALALRIGIHVGPMLGGIVGKRLPRYHLFGPHAQLAAILEQAGEPSAPLISDAFRRLLTQVEDDGVGVFDLPEPHLGMGSTSGSGGKRSDSSTRCHSLSQLLPDEMSASWNVTSWQALPHTTQGFLDPGTIPDEIGPVVLDVDDKGKPTAAARLQRRHDIEGPSVEGMDRAVLSALSPCWLVMVVSAQRAAV